MDMILRAFCSSFDLYFCSEKNILSMGWTPNVEREICGSIGLQSRPRLTHAETISFGGWHTVHNSNQDPV